MEWTIRDKWTDVCSSASLALDHREEERRNKLKTINHLAYSRTQIVSCWPILKKYWHWRCDHSDWSAIVRWVDAMTVIWSMWSTTHTQLFFFRTFLTNKIFNVIKWERILYTSFVLQLFFGILHVERVGSTETYLQIRIYVIYCLLSTVCNTYIHTMYIFSSYYILFSTIHNLLGLPLRSIHSSKSPRDVLSSLKTKSWIVKRQL